MSGSPTTLPTNLTRQQIAADRKKSEEPLFRLLMKQSEKTSLEAENVSEVQPINRDRAPRPRPGIFFLRKGRFFRCPEIGEIFPHPKFRDVFGFGDFSFLKSRAEKNQTF